MTNLKDMEYQELIINDSKNSASCSTCRCVNWNIARIVYRGKIEKAKKWDIEPIYLEERSGGKKRGPPDGLDEADKPPV